MRKALYSIVVGIYFLLSSGVVVQLHYCMDRLQEIGFFGGDHQDVCGDCGMDMAAASDCCEDRTEVIKLVQDQSIAQASFYSAKFTTELPRPIIDFAPASVFSKVDRQVLDPLDPDIGLDRYRYRRLAVFRI